MKNSQTSKLQEKVEGLFFDLDPVLYEYKARVQPTPNSGWIEFDAYEFFHWLVDINRVEHFDSDERRVCSNGCVSSVDTFWRDMVISKEGDSLLGEYLTAEELGLSTSKAA